MAGINSNVVFMSHFDGLDGSQTIIDEIGNVIIANGNAQIDTSDSVFGGASVLFDNNPASRLTIPNSPSFNLGSQDFRFDLRLQYVAVGGTQAVWAQWGGGGSNGSFYIVTIGGNLRFFYSPNGSSEVAISSTYTFADSNFHHVEVSRTGNTLYFFVDGVAYGTGNLTGVTINNSTRPMNISTYADGAGQPLNARVDEARMMVGEGGHTSPFTPPTEPYDFDRLFPSLEWSATGDIQLTPALQWEASILGELTPQVSWNTEMEHKFVPNVVNYPFYFDQPTVKSSSVPMTISGCFVGYSVYLKNTGSSGTTEIEIYVAGILKDTISITASGVVHNEVRHFDLDQMLNPQSIFKVKVISSAVDSDDLKVNMYLMTFPFEMDVLSYSNISDSVNFTGLNKDYLFQSVDNWLIDFNQPILTVSSVTVEDENGDVTDVAHSILDGAFFNSRIQLSPYTQALPKSIKIKVQDYNERYQIFELTPTIAPTLGEYPLYVTSTTKEFELFIAATAFRYSFDAGSTWSDWGAVSSSNLDTIDFSGESNGEKTVKIQYQIGSDMLEEDFSLYYVIGDIDASILWVGDYVLVTYGDTIPLDRIEVYYDGALSDTLSIPVINGFDTFSLDVVNTELDIGVGSIYWNSVKYDYDGSSWSLASLDFASYNYSMQYQAVFGFDTIENKFDVKIIVDENPSNGNFEERFPSFVRIWALDFLINTQGLDFSPYTTQISSTPKKVFEEGRVQVTLDSTKQIILKLIDVSGRTLSFTQDFYKTKYNVWRTLTITKENITGSSSNGTQVPKLAIDDSDSFWTSDLPEPLPAWLRYEFGLETKQIITEVSIKSNFSGDVQGLPKDFKIQATDDGENWVDLHTVVGESWVDEGPKIYSFSNSTAYAFYRLYFTDTSGGSYVQIKELELRETIGGVDLTSFLEIEIFPGEIHQSSEIKIAMETEDWGDEPDGPTE